MGTAGKELLSPGMLGEKQLTTELSRERKGTETFLHFLGVTLPGWKGHFVQGKNKKGVMKLKQKLQLEITLCN